MRGKHLNVHNVLSQQICPFSVDQQHLLAWGVHHCQWEASGCKAVKSTQERVDCGHCVVDSVECWVGSVDSVECEDWVSLS